MRKARSAAYMTWNIPQRMTCFFQIDMMGDDSRASLHTLLLQPVQRIPEYLQLLQVA